MKKINELIEEVVAGKSAATVLKESLSEGYVPQPGEKVKILIGTRNWPNYYGVVDKVQKRGQSDYQIYLTVFDKNGKVVAKDDYAFDYLTPLKEGVTGRLLKSSSDLKKGDTYKIDSGMGGSFTVKYMGQDPGTKKHKFKNVTSKDWAGSVYTYDDADIPTKVYTKSLNEAEVSIPEGPFKVKTKPHNEFPAMDIELTPKQNGMYSIKDLKTGRPGIGLVKRDAILKNLKDGFYTII